MYEDSLINFESAITKYADEQKIPKRYHYERDIKAENKAYIKYLISEGYDGIILHDTKYDSVSDSSNFNTQYAVFDGSQIKSIYNEGTWNPNSKDILK